MVGGKIKNMYFEADSVLFLVQGQGSESNDTCCVRAAIPDVVRAELNIGMNIWWQCGKVYLCVFGVEDVGFEKIGFSGGGENEFKRYTNLKWHVDDFL
jgi:hypothetical protein